MFASSSDVGRLIRSYLHPAFLRYPRIGNTTDLYVIASYDPTPEKIRYIIKTFPPRLTQIAIIVFGDKKDAKKILKLVLDKKFKLSRDLAYYAAYHGRQDMLELLAKYVYGYGFDTSIEQARVANGTIEEKFEILKHPDSIDDLLYWPGKRFVTYGFDLTFANEIPPRPDFYGLWYGMCTRIYPKSGATLDHYKKAYKLPARFATGSLANVLAITCTTADRDPFHIRRSNKLVNFNGADEKKSLAEVIAENPVVLWVLEKYNKPISFVAQLGKELTYAIRSNSARAVRLLFAAGAPPASAEQILLVKHTHTNIFRCVFDERSPDVDPVKILNLLVRSGKFNFASILVTEYKVPMQSRKLSINSE